jgi:hypothetical protein
MEYYASMKPHAKKQKISSQVLDRAELLEKSLRQLPSAGSGRERELPQLESIAAINSKFISTKFRIILE